MTRDQFVAKYRPPMLAFLAECFANRKCPPTDFGLEVDRQFGRINGLLSQAWDDLQPKQEPKPQPAPNGATVRK